MNKLKMRVICYLFLYSVFISWYLITSNCWCLWSPSGLGLQFCTLSFVITPCFPSVWLMWYRLQISKWDFMASKYVESILAILHYFKLKKLLIWWFFYSWIFKFTLVFQKRPSFPSLLNILPFCLFKNWERASLVAQWLRICLLMQGTRVRALVWEDPTCHGAAGPVSHNCWACAFPIGQKGHAE